MKLFTIGYEGAVIDDFVATLLEAGVQVVLDVREVPISRKKGFSKTALKNALFEAGIDYHHFKQLGDPKPGRLAARAGNYDEFRKIYNEHIASDQSQNALTEAIDIAKAQRACLLCFERDPCTCHRSIVLKEMQKAASFTQQHLGVKEGMANSRNDSYATHASAI
ncbi:MAG: DUF488 domain-containing protein [Pseudomonadota bacterium]